jgi:hypothetical protein
MDGSVEYAIDCTLCANGVDSKLYHGQCLIGPQIMKLLANRVEIMSQREMKFLHVRDESLTKDPTTDLASIEEIREQMDLFGRILHHCYDWAFSFLRRTRSSFLISERKELLGAIKILTPLWPTHCMWEKKAASVTPELHDLWFEEVPQQLTYLGRFYHFMEDPMKKPPQNQQAGGCHLLPPARL